MRPLTGTWLELDPKAPSMPIVKVLAFDLSLDSINDIVTGMYTQVPVDLSEYIIQLQWGNEGCNFTLVDSDRRFHPDSGEYRKYLQPMSVIRVVEGDQRVPEAEWYNSFTGLIVDFPNWQWSRRNQANVARVAVISRGQLQSYQKRKITTKEYTAGTDAGIMLRDVVRAFFEVTDAENRIPLQLGFQLLHKVSQLVQVTPNDALKILMEVVGGVAYWDGDGKLAYYVKDLNRPPVKTLTKEDLIDVSIQSSGLSSAINRVVVQFLDATPEPVEGPYQVLGTASVTTGFFRPYERLECWWSQDRRLRAKNSRMKVLQSVNAGLLPVGDESYYQVDDFHGIIEVEIHAWVPILVSVLMASYIAMQMKTPDKVVVPLGGTGWTIPVGRLACAIDLIAILVIMASIGTGHYEVWGVPWELVYVEKQAIAEECNLEYWQRNEKKIENDLIGSFDQAMPIAINELIWEKTVAIRRQLVVKNDPSIEVGDILLLPDGKRYIVLKIDKSVGQTNEPFFMRLETARVITGAVGGSLEV